MRGCFSIYIFAFILFSCKEQKREQSNYYDMSNVSDTIRMKATILTDKELDSLTQNVYLTGNEDDFYTISMYYLHFGDKEKYIELCKYMSDKYNNANAQYNVYQYIRLKYEISSKWNKDKDAILYMSYEDREIAIFYLKKAKDNKHSSAIDEYGKLVKMKIIN